MHDIASTTCTTSASSTECLYFYSTSTPIVYTDSNNFTLFGAFVIAYIGFHFIWTLAKGLKK